jgi:alkylated DNA repair dioxygenase AlkB
MSRRIELDGESWIEQGLIPSHPPLSVLWELHPVEFGAVRIMGREIPTPRWQQSYDRAYWYSGMLHEAPPLPPAFQPFKNWVNTLFDRQWTFNQTLINWYENGHHYIGPHSDDTRQLVNASPIVSISLGQPRLFRIRKKNNKENVLDLEMPNGTYVVMGGKMQESFTHEVPKVQGKKGEALGHRVNITFRCFKD